jgi:hypothetical protein
MSETERTAFLASCSGEVCVSYALRPAIVAAASAVALVAWPAAAQDLTPPEEVIMVGGINAAQIEYVADPDAVDTIDMPIVYEDEAGSEAAVTEFEGSATDSSADLGHAVETEQAR